MFEFQVHGALPGKGRVGSFSTPHGIIHTPVFMPVGTAATVKSLSPDDLETVGAQIILANNYHLYLRPGSDRISQLGGIHEFMNWPHPVLTDSGGFQIWSLGQEKAGLIKISEDGISFKSHLDGSTHVWSPETAIMSQIKIGADIIMAFDQCTSDQAPKKEAEAAMLLTHKWLERSIATWKSASASQALFGIIQGAMHEDLRRRSAECIVSHDLPGIAVGGETIGYNMEGTETVMTWIEHLLPPDKPRYAMGLGLRPSDIVRAILAGFDMFDCVGPTRLARNGALYTGQVVWSEGIPRFESSSPTERIDIAHSRYADDISPIDPGCDCYTCSSFSRAYLHHLFRSKELLYYRLASIHNLRMMIKTARDVAKGTN